MINDHETYDVTLNKRFHFVSPAFSFFTGLVLKNKTSQINVPWS